MNINLQETPVSDINVTNQFDLFIVGNATFHWKHKENIEIEFTGTIEEFNEFLLEKIDTGDIIVPEKSEPETTQSDTIVVDTPADTPADAIVVDTPADAIVVDTPADIPTDTPSDITVTETP